MICSLYGNPLTIGHIQYLYHASRLGKVWVIVNNDEQVKLKGSIPFQDQNERLAIITYLNLVDKAFLSKDNDSGVYNTIDNIVRLHPEKKFILFNDGDRTEENCNKQEDELCESLNIQQVWGGNPKVQSSSKLIEKAAKEWIKKNVI